MDTQKIKNFEKVAEETLLKPNGWNEWAKYVLLTTEEHGDKLDKLSDKITSLQLDLRELKTKVTLRATALGAAIPTISYIIVKLIENNLISL